MNHTQCDHPNPTRRSVAKEKLARDPSRFLPRKVNLETYEASAHRSLTPPTFIFHTIWFIGGKPVLEIRRRVTWREFAAHTQSEKQTKNDKKHIN